MTSMNPEPGTRGGRPRATIGGALLAVSVVSSLAVAPPGTARAQDAWRGLNVPHYPNATDYTVKADEDERDIYFRSGDDARAVFDFYRGYLERQGFRVTESRPTTHGFKADMVRGQGGPADKVELDAKLKHGRYKVEIEFDE